jgi:hypothetical protein
MRKLILKPKQENIIQEVAHKDICPECEAEREVREIFTVTHREYKGKWYWVPGHYMVCNTCKTDWISCGAPIDELEVLYFMAGESSYKKGGNENAKKDHQ